MKRYKFVIFFLCLCAFLDLKAQLSTNERPVSFGRESEMITCYKSTNPIAIMPQLDVAKLEQEDREDEEYDVPPRFGYPHRVNYDLNNSGIWYELPNGDKLWQLEVVCPGALSVNFCYDKFWIPEGSKLFVYSKDRKHCIGAFTSTNNKGDRENIRGFATGLVYGDDVILEYYQPKEVSASAIISIEYVVHGYRYIQIETTGFGGAGNCMVNVNCEEGRDWQQEKRAVALTLVNGHRWCTGSLINTTDLSQRPFFLTANHCLGSWANAPYTYDAETLPYLDHYSFYWNYEAPGCINDNIEPCRYSTSGAIVVANDSITDFALLRLVEDPKDSISGALFYMGWDCSGQSGNPGVCVHHPNGDVKKISTVDGPPLSTSWPRNPEYTNSHWEVGWASTLNGHGMVQGGSSGSPLLNAMHRLIGQLHGSDCQECNNDTGHGWYGKFDVSWIGYNTNSTFRRLNCWLDSLNTNVQKMDGLLVIPSTETITTDEQLYCNMRITETGKLTVQSDVEMMGNSRVIVEFGGKLIIDGGTISNIELELMPGAYLQITDGGILETRNGFNAPVGAIVDIQSGKIL